MCDECRHMPCAWTQIGNEVVEEVGKREDKLEETKVLQNAF